MTQTIDPVLYNKAAWDQQVRNGNPWTIPVSSEAIGLAKKGNFSLVLTPQKAVPKEWFPPLQGCKILALASGGGQQGVLLAAAGAHVTVFDNSPEQLNKDREVAARDGLTITLIEGDMMDLSRFKDESFDFIFHPCSNGFVPDVNKVWRGCYRVLKKGGTLISGFCNPVLYTPDFELEKQGVVQMRYSIPFSDLESLTAEERARLLPADEPLSYGHSLADQLGGQIAAGFVINGFYEDSWNEAAGPIHKYLDCFIATRALKL